MEALLLVAVLVLVLLNGFFVAAEFALVRTRRSALEAQAEDGSAGARRALEQLDELPQFLSAAQLGITLTSLGIGFLGEPAVASLLERLFGDAVPHGLAVAVSIALAYLIVTAIHITIGEQVPKIYAIVTADTTSARVARPLWLFNAVMRPFISLLNAVSNAILRTIRIDPDAEFEEGQSPQQLRALIVASRQGGKLDPGEAGMLTGVFHLHEQEARQVMTPIPAVVTVDVAGDVESALRQCVNTGHTRLVVTEDDNTDRVRGIVHANRLAQLMLNEGPHASIEPAVRDALIVPETKPLDDLLADLQRNRSSLAVVVDEYGRVAGIVTIEDIIEEVVGEIDDETDPAGGDVRRLANGDWYVRGHVAVTDLVDYGVELPTDSDAYNSIGGLVFGQLGRLPRRGDTIHVDGYSVRVESVTENRIEAVRIRPRAAAGARSAPAA